MERLYVKSKHFYQLQANTLMFYVRELSIFLARFSNDEKIEEANRTDLEGYIDETSYTFI